DSREDPEPSRLRTRRGRPGRRRLGEEAAVAGPFRWMEDGGLSLELPDRAIDERLVEHDGRVVGEVARREVVAAVHDDVERLEDAERVLGREPLAELDYLDVRVERLERHAGGLGLRHPDAVVRVENLTLQVREVDHVHVDEADRPHARGGEVEGRRRAETAGADAEHLGVEELRLARLAHFGKQEVAAVADLLLGGELPVRGHGQTLVLPGREPTAHRRHLRVAELLEDAPGEQGARTAGAVGDDRGALVRYRLLDAHLEQPPRQRDRLRHVALAELLLLAHVEQHRTRAAVELALHLLRRDLWDELPGLLHDLLVALCHRSALDPVEQVHTVLEPARHRSRMGRGDEQAADSQYAPHGIPTREDEGVTMPAEEMAQLLAVEAPEETPSPERQEDHAFASAWR